MLSLDDFLERRAGLSKAQIPWVLSTFLGVKYLTWGAFVLTGARYRPLSRLFRGVKTRTERRFGAVLTENE
ncbi:hypothetical protein TeGR_g8893, partial [Tetraparma gracilis]